MCSVCIYIYTHIYICIYRERAYTTKYQAKKNHKIDKRSEKTVSQRRTEMVNKHRKICSMLLVYQGNANQNHRRYHLISSRMIIIKQTTNNQMLEMIWRKRDTGTLCWDCKLVQSVWKTYSSFLRKLKIKLPYDPAILILGISLKNMKIQTVKDMHTQMFITALFTIAKLWK